MLIVNVNMAIFLISCCKRVGLRKEMKVWRERKKHSREENECSYEVEHFIVQLEYFANV